MLKDEQDFSYGGGGDASPLKTWSDFSSVQYVCIAMSYTNNVTYWSNSALVLLVLNILYKSCRVPVRIRYRF